jgi:tetratricopeptide (TPR) repeat protein
MLGQPTQAISLLEEAVAKKQPDERAMFALALHYESQNRQEEALETMRRVLRINPDHVLAMNFIAYTLAQKGHSLDEAERLMLRALEKKPNEAAFLDSLGWVYFRAGKWNEAVVPLEKAVGLSPEDPTIQEHLGDVYVQLKEYALARKAYEPALQGLQEKPELAETPEQRRNIEGKIKVLVSQPDAR